MLLVNLARNDYEFYCEYTHRGLYKPGKHTRLICDYLLRVEQAEIEKLMIFMPPRHSKSMTVTETFPSYFIGKDPERRVISVSYSGGLAKRFGRANKQKLEEYGPDIFKIGMARDQASVTDWGVVNHRGGMLSTGLGGTITGEGADLLLIDDPIKNRKEANSVTYRENLWNEWQNTLVTRLQPGGVVILVLTRWHEDDLAGRLLEQEGNQWTVLRLPCEAEDKDPLGRSYGEPLWPQYGFDQAWMDKRKKEVGSRTWASLYQQRPTAEEGELIKRHWWRFWCYPGQEKKLRPVTNTMEDGTVVEVRPEPLPEKFDITAQSWDMSFKEVDESSYVVGQVWSKRMANSYLRDQLRERLDFPATVRAVLGLSKKWPEAGAKWIEDKANGPAVLSTLKRKLSGLIAIQPYGSKEARVHAVSPEIEAGNVYLPHPAIEPWVKDFIEECAGFPNAANDDQVDAMSQALNKLQGRVKQSRPLGRKPRGL